MKINLDKLIMAFILCLVLSSGPVRAEDQGDHAGHHGHGGGAMDMGGHAGHGGNRSEVPPIAEKTVDGYTLSFYLHDMTERKQMMKGMEGMKMHGMSDSPDITHHLMVYIRNQDGETVSGKVGFIVKGPEGKETKTLTMGMHGGYGADVGLGKTGEYRITTKAVIDGRTIVAEFSHVMK
ncbi:MAG: hypothetical protein ACOZF0_05620 [Thermodesulfobacteriota bacterium]